MRAAVIREVDAYQQMAMLEGTSAVLTLVQGHVIVEGNAAPWAAQEQNPPEVVSSPRSQHYLIEGRDPSTPPHFPLPPPSPEYSVCF